MSNPKGLKNIPAIRQKVAMFLRNICLQVITIHLFGFKVYEFEKNQILFNKYFVQMNILYIFVEIIKKSTTMKNLILTVTFVLVSLVSFSQCPQVKSKMDSSVYHTYMTIVKSVKFLNDLGIPYVSLPDRILGKEDIKSHSDYFGYSFSKLPNDDFKTIPFKNILESLRFSNPDEELCYKLFMGTALVTEFKLISVDNESIKKVLIVEYFYKWGESKDGLFSTTVLYQDESLMWNYVKSY
jgi:hypothetical protein